MTEHAKLTPEQIAQIAGRWMAATPEPWVYRLDDERPDWRTVLSTTHPLDVAHIPPWGGGIGEHNAAFIANSPMDIHRLLNHVAALEAENAALRKAGEKLAQTWRTVAVSKEETAAMYFRSEDMYADALKRSTEAAMLSACAKSLDELLEGANE